MYNKIFDINTFNIFSDDENYYFFRALEEVDIESINSKTILDEFGNINKLITDREFYGETIFKKDDPISLEQVIEHIKIDYNKHTNCISFSSNTNVILDYGRNTFNDKYVMFKVPKSEFGKKVINAGEYIYKEISKVLESYYKELSSDDLTKYYFDAIDNARNYEQLNNIKSMLTKEYIDDEKNIFVNGVSKLMKSQTYNALSEEQNLLKDKLVLKMDLMNKPVLNRIGNKFLVSILGGAFSSLEIIHYNDVEGNLTEISPEIMDILSLIQQVPENKEIVELKKLLIKKINNKNINTKDFDLDKYNIDSFKDKLTIDNIYNLTGGNIEFNKAKNIYTKAYILAKSRMRKEKSLSLLKNILNDSKYDNVIEYLRANTYGIESEITNRISNKDSINLSESVNLLVSSKEQYILNYINKLSINEIENILENPIEALQDFMENNYIEKETKEDWYSNSLIDLIDCKYYGLEDGFSLEQKESLLKELKEFDIVNAYNSLKTKNLSDEEIANTLFIQTVSETGIQLKPYQKIAFNNINKAFKEKDYTSVILPTGTGKSYLALSVMYHYEQLMKQLESGKSAKILYLAPNNYILDQLSRIVAINYGGNKNIIKEVFPGLTLTTYSYLGNGKEAEEIINDNYDLIICDELHRTGASEWSKNLDRLLEHQNAKILGLTATPERDMDNKDMSEIFAKKYGYTDEEILEGKHMSYSMTLLEAIERGIIHNPKVINCEYSLVKSGSLDELKYKIDNIQDETLRKDKNREYEQLRREVVNADGIEKILKENIKEDGKYIVFIPLTKREDGKVINTDTEEELTEKQAQTIIRSYKNLMNQFLFSGEYLETNKENLSKVYEKINNNEELNIEEIVYLNKEKENILLLTKLAVNKSQNNPLQTLTNDIAESIIKYMHWERLSDTEIGKKLNKRMKNEVESYSMLSCNSKRTNEMELSNFNSSTSPKKKFMFVMDMLNEGVHVSNIDGIIWFRALNENSKILFLQQLGRCISAIGEDNKDKIPAVIDLVNNTLKINIEKGIKKEKEDLRKLIEISNIMEKNYFSYNMLSKEENLDNMKILRKIRNEYQKYLDEELLEEQKVERKHIIQKIIEIGCDIDLWNTEFVNEFKSQGNIVESIKSTNDLLSIFRIEGRLRRFSELYNSILNEKLTDVEYVELVEKFCEKYNDWPTRDKDSTKEVDGKIEYQLGLWLNNKYYTKDFKLESELKERLSKLKTKIIIEKQNDLTEEYIKYLYVEDLSKKVPKRRGYVDKKDKTSIGGATMGTYLNTERTVVKKLEKKLAKKETLTEEEQNRIDNYNRIIEVKNNIKSGNWATYDAYKQEFDSLSDFSRVNKKVNNKEADNGRKIS